MPNNTNRRAVLGALALTASSAALWLSAADVEAAEWHNTWGTAPVIAPELGDVPAHAYGSCEFSLPAGQSAPAAAVGVHFDHTWVEMHGWRVNLGYSPEVMSYYLCTAEQGTSSWHAAAFFPLWRYARQSSPGVYYADSSQIPSDQLRPEDAPSQPTCPGHHPILVGAFCQTRVWW